MMISDKTEAKFLTNKNSNTNDVNENKGSSSSTQWLRLKDPRIVRVSRAFGGKDRHSKVNTVRGLRDRRVRLSVPTAIQLYDLQDRLGLNQPSKAVDWLLNAAKNEIDELPPLPITNFVNFEGSKRLSKLNILRGSIDKEQGNESNRAMPYGTYYHQMEPSNFESQSDFGSCGSPIMLTTQPYFTSQTAASAESDQIEINYFEMLGTKSPLYVTGQSTRTFPFSLNPRENGNQQNKEKGQMNQM